VELACAAECRGAGWSGDLFVPYQIVVDIYQVSSRRGVAN
jgi:hypothetical protein